ncbi:diacylglycerol/lipid kinase family protein [Pseudooceanicola sp. MF1-13]|uniref:diacylglycerol/lipid kinase family protein n=1 Tax=Pseudooceanicola sp. MF1-13 TaxID=3379095 RepID=UPI0038927077
MPLEMPHPTSLAPQASQLSRVFIVANPGSGRRDPDLFPLIERTLAEDSDQHKLAVADDGADLTKLAKSAIDQGYDTVVAAGGDGTIAAVAQALFDAHQSGQTPPSLGVIPLGTFNYVARSLNLPLEDPETATRTLLSGTPSPFALGEVNGKVFLNNASLGAYPAILDQREDIYRRYGRSRVAAYWSVLRTLSTLRYPLSLQIDVDGKAIRRKSALAFIANSSYQIEQFDLPGAEDVRKGKFAVYVAPDTGRYRLILSAIRLAGRRAQLGRDMEMVTGSSVTIETRQKSRLIARDGEKEKMSGPFRFRIHTDALKVICPT